MIRGTSCCTPPIWVTGIIAGGDEAQRHRVVVEAQPVYGRLQQIQVQVVVQLIAGLEMRAVQPAQALETLLQISRARVDRRLRVISPPRTLTGAFDKRGRLGVLLHPAFPLFVELCLERGAGVSRVVAGAGDSQRKHGQQGQERQVSHAADIFTEVVGLAPFLPSTRAFYSRHSSGCRRNF